MLEIISIYLLSLILIPVAKDDWKDSLVDGRLCLIAWVCTGIAWFLCGHGLWTGIIIAAMCVVFYAKSESDIFGSADFLPVAMYFAVYLQQGFTTGIIIMYPVCLLAVLVPYGKFYAKTHGFEWKLGDRVFMPMLPCMAAAWWLSAVCYTVYYILTKVV